MLNNSNLIDLRIPPANRLEKLAGNLKKYYSIRVNDQCVSFLYGTLVRRVRLKLLITISKNMKLKNTYPGEVLQEEFLTPFGITAYRLSKDLSIPQTRVSEILKGNRRITADTALRLSKYFGNSAKFWLGLQNDFDIEEEKNTNAKDLNAIKPISAHAA